MAFPGDQAPGLDLTTLAHGRFRLVGPAADGRDTLLIFYRGLHCPLCRAHLAALEASAPDFDALGVRLVAVTGDGPDRAGAMAERAGLRQMTVAHSMAMTPARDAWGLFISDGLAEWDEPELFFEPGHLLVGSGGRIAYRSVQNMPYGRPHPQDLLHGISFVQTHGYPIRGTWRGTLSDG